MLTDLTFITNEPGQTLKDRFEGVIKDSRFFDCLVGYFYVSGFHALHKARGNTEKIKILIDIGSSKETYELIKFAEEARNEQSIFSHQEVKDKIPEPVKKEMEESEDNPYVFNYEKLVERL